MFDKFGQYIRIMERYCNREFRRADNGLNRAGNVGVGDIAGLAWYLCKLRGRIEPVHPDFTNKELAWQFLRNVLSPLSCLDKGNYKMNCRVLRNLV